MYYINNQTIRMFVYIVRDNISFQLLGAYTCPTDASRRAKECPNSTMEVCKLNFDRTLCVEPESG